MSQYRHYTTFAGPSQLNLDPRGGQLQTMAVGFKALAAGEIPRHS